jgi:GTPase SAR1 family protein
MFVVFIIGTAGSGKTTLITAFNEWLRNGKQDVAVVNLDPGVMNLPYSPDVDVRDYVDVQSLMEENKLGPNGALIVAADMIADKIEQISDEIEELKSDVVLIDTSGQMELFAFRASGPYVANELLKGEPRAIVYLFDAVFSFNPLNYVSNMFLSAAVQNRFFLPQMHVLSKSDLIPKEQLKKIVDWSAHKSSLQEAIEQNLEGSKRLLSRNIMNAVYELGMKSLLIPVSARTNEGIINLNTALERVLTGGDKYTTS